MNRYDQVDAKRIIDRIETWSYDLKFPGAQPVSFSFDELTVIQSKKSIVCEKTDGFRFLLVEVIRGNQTLLFLVDRQYKFRQIWHFHPSEPKPFMQQNSQLNRAFHIVNIFDGELVNDHPWRKDNSAPIFLIFDSILTNS